MSGLIVSLAIATHLSAFAQVFNPPAAARAVEILDNQLVVDGQKQPQLFGAEVQYFRLRGGYGPNIPRARVLALWNRALDLFVRAKMNAISFYIPWDFHEYAEGKFDFTGTVDADGDGRADYPSRDLVTFFKLIADHGITRIMVRPGPYINAEWGFLGFGAIPKWFHDKYPDSHMRTPFGQRSRVYDYQDPDLLRQTKLWFQALYDQVLRERMGPGKPVIFLQLDNETNYQWQSLYSQDFGRHAISRYQSFLENLYQDLTTLNKKHGRIWERWTQIQPPTTPGRNNPEDQDWYRFADQTIYQFLFNIRNLWAGIGVSEPNVLFTLAESYNAPLNGLLPNYVLRNAPNATGLMTVNLYPKTIEDSALLNFPFKADLDVKSADEANDSYFGSRQEWVLGPEIQGGWWRGTNVTPEARQQTYLTVLGHGLKAFFVYYFNEGENWDVEWSHDQVQPIFVELLRERRLENLPLAQLPEDFWNELQARTNRKILVGLDVRRIMKLGAHHDNELFFDAPLDGQANPRNHYFQLKKIGKRVVAPYQDFLARSLEVHDNVALVKDSASHQPTPDANISSVQAAADWTGGLLGYLMNSNINPRILHGDLSPESSFQEAKFLVHLDTGVNDPRTLEMLKEAWARGQFILNFLASDVAKFLEIEDLPTTLFVRDSSTATVPLTFYVDPQGQLRPAGESDTVAMQIMSSKPVYSYELAAGCEGVLYSGDNVVGYRCKSGGNGGSGDTHFVQIGALLFEEYNSSNYAQMQGLTNQRIFLQALLNEAGVKPELQLSDSAERTVAFARKDPDQKLLWITVKAGTPATQSLTLKVSEDLLRESLKKVSAIRITDVLSAKRQTVSSSDLTQIGFQFKLPANGSTVFVLE